MAESFKEISSCPSDHIRENVADINDSILVLLNTSAINNNHHTSNSSDYEFSGFLSVCENKRILQIIEMSSVAYFSCELILRLIFCPNVKTFYQSPQNIIDVLATVPFYIELILSLLQYQLSDYSKARNVFFLIQILRCFRVIRILKLARYIEELRILGKTLNAAKDELCMLILFVMIAVFIFSSIIYQVEKDEPDSQFSSIPASCWW